MRRTVFTLLAVAGAATVSCAHDEPLPPPEAMPPEAAGMPAAGRLVLTGLRKPIVALITETGIQGPEVNLGRYPVKGGPTAWRGTAFAREVNLEVSVDGAEGIAGRTPLDLRVAPEPGSMVVNGLIAGAPSTVTISRARINGAFGRCGYDLRFQGQAYVGSRSCGGTPVQVGLTLPPILNTWPDAEVATVLAILLSGR